MIRKYVYGNPYDTGAVVKTLPAETGTLPYFEVEQSDSGLCFSRSLSKDEVLFGLGEAVRGMNKRGYVYESWNSDVFDHTESQSSLYASLNLLLFCNGEQCFGLYLDDPGRVRWDLGYTVTDRACITSENGDLALYLCEGDSLRQITRELRALLGQSYLPPKWAFGYIQSRWGYASEKDIRAVAQNHRSRHIPLDGICMDIDYMQDYRDFTWNREAFPDLKGFADQLKQDHLHLVPIIDAGIKLDEKEPLYQEGLQRDLFCKKADGSVFVGAVWPGRACFPDFLNTRAREWFGSHYNTLLDEGIDGFWNDMNEPAIFYSDETLARGFEIADELRGENIGLDGSFKLKDAFGRMANHPDDYRRFYHDMDGRRVRHDRVHNLYGAMMTRSAAEAFRKRDANKRVLLFSRSAFAGAHRYGGMWQGDNFSWWSHIALCMHMLPALNMSGFLFTGCDLGGFGCNTTEDLLERFLQLGVFTPLMRNHSALGTREQEIYRFSTWESMRDTLTVRYALLPYLYSEYMKAVRDNDMLFRPLAMDYPGDERALHTEDQLMWGSECMIAPVTVQNAVGRYVYLPEDMLMIRFRSAKDHDLEPMTRGDHYISLRLNEFALFIKKGCVIPFGQGAENSEDAFSAPLTLLGWAEKGASYRLYTDDGTGYAPLPTEHDRILRKE